MIIHLVGMITINRIENLSLIYRVIFCQNDRLVFGSGSFPLLFVPTRTCESLAYYVNK